MLRFILFVNDKQKVMLPNKAFFSIHAHNWKYLKSVAAPPRRTKLHTLPELLSFLAPKTPFYNPNSYS